MHYYRCDGNILDFTRGPTAEKIIMILDNCLVRERKERISLFSFKMTMACTGAYKAKRPLDFYMIKDKQKLPMTCDRCKLALLGCKKLCAANSFVLPEHFHHRKANFESIKRMLIAGGDMQLPVPDPMTWSYMTFRY